MLMAVALLGVNFSCSDGGEIIGDETSNLPHLFRPVGISGTPLANTIDLSWSEISGAAYYFVEYATDKNFQYNYGSFETPNATASAVVTGLAFESSYFFRITAIAADESQDDSAVSATSSAIKTGTAPKLLQPITQFSDADMWAKASWVTTSTEWITSPPNSPSPSKTALLSQAAPSLRQI